MSSVCAVLKVVYEHPGADDQAVVVRPGERCLVGVVCGKLVAQPVPADAVVIVVSDLPALLSDPSVVSAALAAECRRALDDR